MSNNNSKKDPDGSYYQSSNANDDDELNNYYSNLLNLPSTNTQPAAFATTNVSITDYDITGGGDYNYTSNSNNQGRRIFRYTDTNNEAVDTTNAFTNNNNNNNNTNNNNNNNNNINNNSSSIN